MFLVFGLAAALVHRENRWLPMSCPCFLHPSHASRSWVSSLDPRQTNRTGVRVHDKRTRNRHQPVTCHLQIRTGVDRLEGWIAVRRPRWRKMTWVLIVWVAVILIWAIAGGGSAANSCSHQHGDQFLSAHSAAQACDAGAGLGVAVILVIGFVGFVFFSLIWLMTRPHGRDCPVCGNLVKRGQTTCSSCGHDFRAAAQPRSATA